MIICVGIMSDHACRQANMLLQHCHMQDSMLDERRSSGACSLLQEHNDPFSFSAAAAAFMKSGLVMFC